MLPIIEESQLFGKVLVAFKSTFLALIPKKDSRDVFNEFRSISLWKMIYKITSKVISHRLKLILSFVISQE